VILVIVHRSKSVVTCYHIALMTFGGVTTCLENLEMSGILTILTTVGEMSRILLKVTKSQGSVEEKILSEKSRLKLFIVSCIFASIFDFAELEHFILVSDHALLHSYPHH